MLYNERISYYPLIPLWYTLYMKLVILYGPPGVGKLTVARLLAKKTGYHVLHNHLFIELLCSLFDWGSKPYTELITRYRLELLEMASTQKLSGVIMTFIYGVEINEKEVRKLYNTMKKKGVRVYFVKLDCNLRMLEKRITQHSRKEFTKIRKVRDLRRFLKKHSMHQTTPVGENFLIDTTNKSAQKVASSIISSLDL